jgi:DNA-binding LytR/AlgR family response regulator
LSTFADVDLVDEAEDGREAVSLIVRERPHLALLDVRMPELDGLSLIRALKQHEDPLVAQVMARVEAAAATCETDTEPMLLARIPLRSCDELTFVGVSDLASVVAEQELLHLYTFDQTRHTITYRLKDLEAKLDPRQFVRLGRGTLVNIDALVKVTAMPGGAQLAVLSNGQTLPVSRAQSRRLRTRIFRL